MVENFSAQHPKGRNVDPKSKKFEKVEIGSLTRWKTIFNTPYRKSILKEYIQSFDDESLEIMGYQKQEILDEISQLNNKGKYSLFKDIIQFNRVKLYNRYNRLSFN